jgi:ABC-type multidrug transport system fused ATPase/permease subunit
MSHYRSSFLFHDLHRICSFNNSSKTSVIRGMRTAYLSGWSTDFKPYFSGVWVPESFIFLCSCFVYHCLSFSPCSLGYYIICLFLLVLLAIILSVFFSLFSWLLYYLSFSPCSLGYYIIFLFLFVLLAIILSVFFFFFSLLDNIIAKRTKRKRQTDNLIAKRTKRKRQII